ncbi:hypothetical protein [Streptomyces sp. NPDC059533]|uniref:hypothetical protein n=1 Tax=Streptomyces sp. NPDC059533 TaxID=3346858 RepID=UPI003698766F
MTDVLLVHGIWNRQKGMTPQEAATLMAEAARPVLGRGLHAAGLAHVPLPDVAMAYYSDLLGDDDEVQSGGSDGLEDLSEAQLAEAWEWLVAAGVPVPNEPQAGWLVPVRQGIGWLARRRTGRGVADRVRQELTEWFTRLVVACIKDLDAYTSRPETREAVRQRVADAMYAGRPRVLIAHSLGSVVAYETLHAYPDLKVDLFLTLGSPLGLPALSRKLQPAPRGGRGARPPGAGWWINIADAGDPVAVPPELGGMFPVDAHATTDIGLFDPHTLGGYLANGLTAAALAPYIS